MGNQENAYEGKWDFRGSCAPKENSEIPEGKFGSQQTFTLGCFQWVKRSTGNKLRQGKVQKRIKGLMSNPNEAYEKARKYCEDQNKAQKSEYASK